MILKKILPLILCLVFFSYLICQSQAADLKAGSIAPTFTWIHLQGLLESIELKVGDVATNFSLPDVSGKTVELNNYIGKSAVLVVFWVNGSNACIQEIPELKKLVDKYKNKGLTILSVNGGQNKETVEKVIKNNGINYPVLLDIDGNAFINYGAEDLPLNVLIDLKGKVVYYKVGELPSASLINKTIPVKN